MIAFDFSRARRSLITSHDRYGGSRRERQRSWQRDTTNFAVAYRARLISAAGNKRARNKFKGPRVLIVLTSRFEREVRGTVPFVALHLSIGAVIAVRR